MTAPKRALTDLRSTAEQTILADLRVTPELKAKLRRRIETASATPAPPKSTHTPWLRWGGLSAAAVATMMALVIWGQSAPKATKSDQKADGYGRGATTSSAPMQPQFTIASAPGAVETTVTSKVAPTVTGVPVAPKEAQTVTVTAADANGNAVQTTATNYIMADQTGNAIQVSGVEAQPGRKIVLNAEFELQVTDAVSAMQRFQTLAATTAGYVVDASLVKGGDGSWAGRLVLRLPSGQYNGAVQEIRRIGEVRQERQWSQDVTERYYDLEARIRIQEEYERKLQELAGKATTFDDWMKLTRQINDTRALIEQMQGSLKLLGNQADFSTINISFHQPAPGRTPPPAPAQGLWPSMARSFQASVHWFAQLGQSLMIGAAGFAPFLVALLVLAPLALLGYRRIRRP